jgi:hypothetical protein
MKYLLLLFALPVFGQKSVLDEYVATAFQQNITLQQKSIQVEKAMIALKTVLLSKAATKVVRVVVASLSQWGIY